MNGDPERAPSTGALATGDLSAGTTGVQAGGTSPWRGAEEHSSAAEITPTHVGRYRLDRLLGFGGFGRVYLAFDEQLGRAVAVKIARSRRVATAEQAEAFLAEARALAHLDHANILPVYDAGRDGELCFVVSRYVEGMNLSERLTTGALSVSLAVRIATDIARALEHAHARGIIHRDVKPSNVLLGTHGKVFLADFGLALREQESGPSSGLTGTPAYMSPEQASGRGAAPDGRSDVFGLGVVLYEMLTGTNPFRSATREECLERTLTFAPLPPRSLNAAIPLELERVCLRALAKPLAERYATAKDMADALDGVLHSPRTPPADTARARRRLTAAACAGLALVAVATAVLVPRDPAPVAAPPPEQTQQPEGIPVAPPPRERVAAAPVSVIVPEEVPPPRPVLVRVFAARWVPGQLALPLNSSGPPGGVRRALNDEEKTRAIPVAWITSVTNGRLVCTRGPRECLLAFDLRRAVGVEWARVEAIEAVIVGYRPLPQYASESIPAPVVKKKDCDPDEAENLEIKCGEEELESERVYYAEIDRPREPGKAPFQAVAYFNTVGFNPPTFSRSDLQFIRVTGKPEPLLLRVNARTPGIYDIECWVTTSHENTTTRQQIGPRATYLFDGKFVGIKPKKGD